MRMGLPFFQTTLSKACPKAPQLASHVSAATPLWSLAALAFVKAVWGLCALNPLGRQGEPAFSAGDECAFGGIYFKGAVNGVCCTPPTI